jgi:hypothetical protein
MSKEKEHKVPKIVALEVLDKNGEKIETIQRYDPDRLDYYRANLADIFVESLTSSFAVEMLSERQI